MKADGYILVEIQDEAAVFSLREDPVDAGYRLLISFESRFAMLKAQNKR